MRTRRQQSSSDPMPLSSGHRPQLDTKDPTGHKPVLLHEVLDVLAIQKDDVVLDATLGGAGHAQTIVQKLGREGVFVGIDADAQAIERARVALQKVEASVHLIEGNFRALRSHLGKHGISRITKALFDLGWSGYQLKAGRGFSFLADEPLLMTYADSPTEGAVTAEIIVNTWKQESIADIIFGWGEERYARRIARAIVAHRDRALIQTSRELADIVRSAVPAAYRRGRTHPATKTFQALRIAVNDELGALKEGLSAAWRLLDAGGRLAVITFHSIEDREVKRMMLDWAREEGIRITKSPIQPSREELLANPRARSAKLRVIEKL